MYHMVRKSIETDSFTCCCIHQKIKHNNAKKHTQIDAKKLANKKLIEGMICDRIRMSIFYCASPAHTTVNGTERIFNIDESDDISSSKQFLHIVFCRIDDVAN